MQTKWSIYFAYKRYRFCGLRTHHLTNDHPVYNHVFPVYQFQCEQRKCTQSLRTQLLSALRRILTSELFGIIVLSDKI